MKRIEINKKVGKGRVRVSRTSEPNVSTSPAKGVTLNSAHGVRLSKSWGGVQTAFQNSRFILRGRWSTKTDTNVNLSKSGLSISQKTNFGMLSTIACTVSKKLSSKSSDEYSNIIFNLPLTLPAFNNMHVNFAYLNRLFLMNIN